MVGVDGRFSLLFSRGSERFETCRLGFGGSERSGFRVPGVGGGSALKMLGFSNFRECWTFKCWSFGFSDVGILGFSDVGIFGFSGMLDFQMFGCWWIVTSNAFVLGWMILQIWRTVKLTFRNPCRWIVTSDAFVLSWMTLRNLRNSNFISCNFSFETLQ